MAKKKYIVHVSYRSHVDVVVYADDSASYEDVIELGKQKAADDNKYSIEEILSNMEEDENTVIKCITNVFEDKNEAYNALLDKVKGAGGYILFNKSKRPTFAIDSDYVAEDGKPTKDIEVKSLVKIADDSSPLRFIGNDDEMYDVDDYLDEDDITELYAIVMGWI